MARYPFPTTFTGWYQVAYSDELAAGAVVTVPAFGRELVLYRGADGRARARDAHCPHLGAHLGHGGVVVGDGLRCPFHGWCFDGDGACAAIPHADKIPPRARLGVWPAHEAHGLILVWHGAAAPEWPPPAVPEHGDPGFAGYVRRRWRVRTHMQEVAENVVDPAHFVAVHGVTRLPAIAVAADGPVFRATSSTAMATPRGEVPVTIAAVGHGVGLWQLRFSGIVETHVVAAFTPVADELLDIRFSFLVATAGGAGPGHGVGAAIIDDISSQLEQDIPIWEHKVYRARPLLTAGEAAIPALRGWARRFYSAMTPES